jgi:carboxyl-terminal processing protease
VPAYDPGALKVTTNKFYRPSGGSTQLRGVASDIVLPSPSDFSDVNESALERPLPWDAVPAAPHELLNRVHPYVDQLREQSNRRVAADKDFGNLAEDVARLKKRLATKSVSLNETERRRELTQSKARQEEYERDARARQAARPATYEITLENLSKPGLPPRIALKKAPSPAPATKDESTKDKSSDVETAGPGSSAHSPVDDIILDETDQILADYVELSARQAAGNKSATR